MARVDLFWDAIRVFCDSSEMYCYLGSVRLVDWNVMWNYKLMTMTHPCREKGW